MGSQPENGYEFGPAVNLPDGQEFIDWADPELQTAALRLNVCREQFVYADKGDEFAALDNIGQAQADYINQIELSVQGYLPLPEAKQISRNFLHEMRTVRHRHLNQLIDFSATNRPFSAKDYRHFDLPKLKPIRPQLSKHIRQHQTYGNYPVIHLPEAVLGYPVTYSTFDELIVGAALLKISQELSEENTLIEKLQTTQKIYRLFLPN